MKPCGIHLRAISHEMLKISILDVSLKITNLRLQPHFPGTNELLSVVGDRGWGKRRNIMDIGVNRRAKIGVGWGIWILDEGTPKKAHLSILISCNSYQNMYLLRFTLPYAGQQCLSTKDPCIARDPVCQAWIDRVILRQDSSWHGGDKTES